MDGAAGTATLSNLRSKRTASERFLEGQQAVAEMEPTEWRVHRLDPGGIRTLSAYHERIIRDPRTLGGEPVLKGTRVTLRTVLASLAEGASTTEILADFPTLSEEDVRAAIAFAATSAQEDLPLAELPIKR